MATSAESVFAAAVMTAAGVRQHSYYMANAAYAGVFANLATYQAALVAADSAFYDAVQAAASTAVITPAYVGSLYPGLIPGKTTTIVSG